MEVLLTTVLFAYRCPVGFDPSTLPSSRRFETKRNETNRDGNETTKPTTDVWSGEMAKVVTKDAKDAWKRPWDEHPFVPWGTLATT